jgi:hypothetical protein
VLLSTRAVLQGARASEGTSHSKELPWLNVISSTY